MSEIAITDTVLHAITFVEPLALPTLSPSTLIAAVPRDTQRVASLLDLAGQIMTGLDIDIGDDALLKAYKLSSISAT